MARETELSEDEAWEIALNDHPEYRQAYLDGTLPDEITENDGNVMNPRLHLAVHVIVERQIANDTPQGMRAIAQQLEELGVSRHEIRNSIALPLMEQMWGTTHKRHLFDEQSYLRELREVVESLR